MDVHFTSTGTPTQVVADIDQQLRQARTLNDGSWPTLASIRDYIAVKVPTFVDEHKAKESKEITVTIALTVVIASGDEAAADGDQPESASTRRKKK